MKELLIVWHSRTGAARLLAQALESGALQAAAEGGHSDDFRVRRLPAHEAQGQDVLAADGLIFCAPENLGSLSGEMKDFFDRCYYAVDTHLAGRPYGAVISAGTDGEGAARQIERICTRWRLNRIAPTLVVRNGAQTPEAILAPKQLDGPTAAQAQNLGGLLAATLLLGALPA
ncbi:flavodoxin family protein [Bordetella avium]|uniref:flavodoxin family protein n=1 Tax=Bordetella avium TaxID=521 RepID=UPI000E0B6DD9|nr:NAD(P)H-dependent oxidoreductase [Bordetella avium]RIQ13901.1 flavodoxin family protein [Bordetella avium]RIQ39597.1 flavodoxin family protein [Bordetella avium]RIQ44397.1 flavodoxin family protein [Bordetella avium]RIQ45385.1 flavodoxin family protein [Bordetella avium]RIQ51435.1 flavodoxin family protein [Bordetella avium]